MGDALWPALASLPRGSGIVFRHYGVPDRTALAHRVAGIARRRHLMLVIAADAKLAVRVGAHGTHMPTWTSMFRPLTAAAHAYADISRAQRLGARLIFLSPVFQTQSHPGAAVLGPVRFGLTARMARGKVAALGGMTEAGYHRLLPLGAQAWGAISAYANGSRPSRSKVEMP